MVKWTQLEPLCHCEVFVNAEPLHAADSADVTLHAGSLYERILRPYVLWPLLGITSLLLILTALR